MKAIVLALLVAAPAFASTSQVSEYRKKHTEARSEAIQKLQAKLPVGYKANPRPVKK